MPKKSKTQEIREEFNRNMEIARKENPIPEERTGIFMELLYNMLRKKRSTAPSVDECRALVKEALESPLE